MDDDETRGASLGAREALRILRAPQWFYFLALPLAGMDGASLASTGGLSRLALGVASSAGALGFAYGINAIADRGSDASKAKNPLVGSADVPAVAYFVLIGAAAVALASGAALGSRSLGFTSGSLVAGALYSAGPRLKSLPLLGLAANTLIFAPLLLLCAPRASSPPSSSPPATAALVATFIGLILQNQLLHEAADADEDARGRSLTTSRLLGARATRLVIPGIAVVFTVVALAVADGRLVGFTSALALAAGSGAAWLVRDAAQARRVHRWVSAVFGAALFAAGLFS